MSSITYDLDQLYSRTFGSKPYRVLESQADVSQLSGSALTADHFGKLIWLPIKFVNLNADIFGATELLLPYCVISMTAKKTIVKTPMVERKGTVKELYSADDYQISIKGFVIDDTQRTFPEKELTILRKLYDLQEAIQLDNALSNIFLDKDTRVVIEGLNLPEVEGGKKHIRPFSFSLESDAIFILEIE